jgi:hypothetical protein
MTANDISIALLLEHEARVTRAARGADLGGASLLRRLIARISIVRARPAVRAYR